MSEGSILKLSHVYYVRMLIDIYKPTSDRKKKYSSFCQFHHKTYPLESIARTAPQSEKGTNIISLETGIPILQKLILEVIIFVQI